MSNWPAVSGLEKPNDVRRRPVKFPSTSTSLSEKSTALPDRILTAFDRIVRVRPSTQVELIQFHIEAIISRQLHLQCKRILVAEHRTEGSQPNSPQQRSAV